MRTTVLLAAALPLLVGGFALAAPESEAPLSHAPVDIREWEVPYENSRPRDPYVGPGDRVWFVGQRTHYVAYLDPASGEFRKYDLEDGAGPHNLIVADDGTVWYAGNRAAHIGRLDPETGDIHKIPTEVRDPHTMVFNREGDIWFTAQGANHVGKLDVDTEEITYIEVPTPRARPYGIVMDVSGNDRPWIVLFGTNKLATVDPGTTTLKEIELPLENARPRRLAQTTDGTVWMVDYAQGLLWAYDPDTEDFRRWSLPGEENSRPYGMSVDNHDRLWMVASGPQPNQLIGFDPATEEFFDQTPIPSGGGTVRHMMYDEKHGEIWFGTDTNFVGRAKVH